MLAMINDIPMHLRNPRLLSLAIYLSLGVLISMSLVLVQSAFAKVTIAVLCLTFALVHTFQFPKVSVARHRIMYFVVQTCLVTSMMVVSHTNDPFNLLFYILTVQAILVMSSRAAIAWIALFFVLASGVALWTRGTDGLTSILFSIAAFVFTAVYGHTIRQVELARHQNEHLLGDLRAAQEQVQALAVAEERNRLARDLHDSAKQQAFALSAQLDAVQSLIGRDQSAAERHLDQAVQLADTLRQELAALILDLRPPALGNLSLAEAVRQYAAEWSQQSMITANVRVQGQRALPPEVERTLFRVAQEALANVARHSQAQTVTVGLGYTEDGVALTIHDDGQGFATDRIAAGVGLHSMRERAATLPDGRLTLDTAPGRGTRVTVQCHV
jgi:signal transduction histidine kinase